MKKYTNKPRVLLFDVETSPSLGWVWGKYDQNVIDFEHQWYLLSFASKWEGEKTQVFALPDFKGYKAHKEDDYRLTQKLWELFDEADIIVGHNVKKFDIRKCNARFIYHRLGPPSPYKVFDTLEAARRVMANNSNKLDDLGRDYDLGRKLAHTGFHLWQACMLGDLKAWRLMKRYNVQDVELLHKFYKLIAPWAPHPNRNLIDGRPKGCPTCGSVHIQSRGSEYLYTYGQSIKMYRCMDCGKQIHGEREKLANKVIFK